MNKKSILTQLFAVTLLISGFIYLISFAENYVKLKINEDSYYLPKNSFDLILTQIQKEVKLEEKQLQLQLEKEFEPFLKTADQNIETYLNWHYSIAGSITQSSLFLAVSSLKIVEKVIHLDQEKMNKLEKEIESRLFSQNLKNQLDHTFQKLEFLRSQASERIADSLKTQAQPKQKPILGRVIYFFKPNAEKHSFSTRLSSLVKKDLIDPSVNKLVISSIIGISFPLFFKSVVKNFTERLVITIAERLAINGAFKVGATTSGVGTSVLAGSVTCGPLCGIVAGIGTFILSEYLINRIDQHFNRSDLKLSLKNLLIGLKDEMVLLTMTEYQKLNQLLFAKNEIKERKKIKMIDLLPVIYDQKNQKNQKN